MRCRWSRTLSLNFTHDSLVLYLSTALLRGLRIKHTLRHLRLIENKLLRLGFLGRVLN